MRVCIVLSSFWGGAPESILQYAKTLINKNDEVHVCGTNGEQKCIDEFLQIGATVDTAKYGLASPSFKKIIGVYSIARKTVKWKPDIIISVGIPISYYISNIANAIKVPLICVIPGGTVTNGAKKIKRLKCDSIIVFSQENIKQMKECSSHEKVHLIQNRIDVPQLDDYQEHYRSPKEEISFFMASRFEHDKVNSIKSVIDLTSDAIRKGFNVKLEIAGDGTLKSELVKYIEDRSCSQHVFLVGYKDCLYDYYRKSDICFGKGRSILEPMIMGRYSVCVSEERTFSIVTPENFDSLMFFNFSGRGIKNGSTKEDMLDLIGNLGASEKIEELVQTQSISFDNYGSGKLKTKFYDNIFMSYKDAPQHKGDKTIRDYQIIVSIIKSYIISR